MAEYKRQRHLLMSLDPVHVGTGGYRLGRVDNSIVREPGTNIPKIPGTSLHGAARAYAAQLYENPDAAGQNQSNVVDPDNNPVCYTFGYIKKNAASEENAIAYSGVVNVFDAQILLFPVHSMIGPVWVSTVERLNDNDFTITDSGDSASTTMSEVSTSWSRTAQLNLGWLMVNPIRQCTITPPHSWNNEPRWQVIKDRIVLVQESLFSHVVNSNLEVRTSVAINPLTGAAEDKALFTYEAIPRTTFLTCDVVLDDYRKNTVNYKQAFPKSTTFINTKLPETWNSPLDVLRSGLRMIEWLGVGGMGTRGFGRLATIGQPVEVSIDNLFSGEHK